MHVNQYALRFIDVQMGTSNLSQQVQMCVQIYYVGAIKAFNNGSFDLGLSNTGLGNTADASGRYPLEITEYNGHSKIDVVTLQHAINYLIIVNCSTNTLLFEWFGYKSNAY